MYHNINWPRLYVFALLLIQSSIWMIISPLLYQHHSNHTIPHNHEGHRNQKSRVDYQPPPHNHNCQYPGPRVSTNNSYHPYPTPRVKQQGLDVSELIHQMACQSVSAGSHRIELNIGNSSEYRPLSTPDSWRQTITPTNNN